MSGQTNRVRAIRVSDPHWCQLEIEAKRLGFSSRHAYIVDRLKIVSKTDKAIEAA